MFNLVAALVLTVAPYQNCHMANVNVTNLHIYWLFNIKQQTGQKSAENVSSESFVILNLLLLNQSCRILFCRITN